MDGTAIASGRPGATSQYRKRRLAALCGAAVAAALFTPVPATADIARPFADRTVAVNVAESAPGQQLTASDSRSAERLAQGLISTGLIGIGLAMGGLVLVAHRRRQW
jgi:hypothetical protein